MNCLEGVAYQYGVTAGLRIFLRLLIDFNAGYERSEQFGSNLFQFNVILSLLYPRKGIE